MQPADEPSMLRFEEVSYHYGTLNALDQLSLVLPKANIGLLGPNGAGKSTLLRLILGLLQPSSGQVQVFGQSTASESLEIRAQLGYMPDRDPWMPQLTAFEMLRFAAELSGIPAKRAKARAHDVLDFMGLGEARHRKLETFSTGMRQRAKLAQALAGDPKLILLDEPTSGLDPEGRDAMLSLIASLPQRTGIVALLATHILPDVEHCCSHAIVLNSGKLLHQGSLDELLNPTAQWYELRVKGDKDHAMAHLQQLGCEAKSADAELIVVRIPPHTDASGLFDQLLQAKLAPRHWAPRRQGLEALFMDNAGD